MKHVLFIAGSFISANFNVMIDVIRARYGRDLMIHTISANNDAQEMLSRYVDVTYYPVYNYKLDLAKKQREKPSFWNQMLFRLVCILTNVAENIIPLAYERTIYRKGKAVMKEYPIEVVYSVCMPFYAHRVAYRLTKHTDMQWLSFWVDPYLNKGIKLSWLQHWCHRYAERVNLQRSKKVYALPEVFENHELWSEFKEKIQIFEIPYITNREVTISNRDIIFAGLFYEGVREPEPMFDIVLKALPMMPPEVMFKFYVKYPEKYAYVKDKSQGRMLFYSFVNRIELNRLLSNCYMLMNVGNMNAVQMPSKVVEYISYRKPILFFYFDQNDRGFRFLKDYPDILSLFVKEDINDNAMRLVEYLNKEHCVIDYETLMNNSLYWKSTPNYIKTIVE